MRGKGGNMTGTEKLPKQVQTPVIRKVLTVATVVLLITVLVLAALGWRAGIFKSMDTMNAFLNSMGIWAPVIFLCIHVIQTIIPVIPGAVACSVGVLAFGPVYGFVYNYIGIVLGSTLAFLLARRFGHGLIRAVVSQKTYDKYIGLLDREQTRFNRLFAIAIFLPFSPDDLLCMLAGVSKMRTRTFLLILVVCKPLFLIPYSLGITSLKTLLLGG